MSASTAKSGLKSSLLHTSINLVIAAVLATLFAAGVISPASAASAGPRNVTVTSAGLTDFTLKPGNPCNGSRSGEDKGWVELRVQDSTAVDQPGVLVSKVEMDIRSRQLFTVKLWVITDAGCTAQVEDTIWLSRHEMYDYARLLPVGITSRAVVSIEPYGKPDKTIVSPPFSVNIRVCR